MKKKLQTIMTGALCAVMLVSLAACSGGGSKAADNLSTVDTTGDSPASSTSDKPSTPVKFDEPIYLSDMLEAGGRRIWYRVEAYNVEKDAEIQQVFVFENGELTVYFLDSPNEFPPDSSIRKLGGVVGFKTIGDVSTLTDDEIVADLDHALMQVYEQEDQKLREEFFAAYDPSVNTEEAMYNYLVESYDMGMASTIIYLTGDDALNDELNELLNRDAESTEWEAFSRRCAQLFAAGSITSDQVEKLENIPERPKPSSYGYTLNIITDGTGNNTKTEKILYTFDNYKSPVISTFINIDNKSVLADYTISDEPYYAREATLKLTKFYTEGAIYDSIYGGFLLDYGNDYLFVTKLPEALNSIQGGPKLDSPDTPGVTVD